MLYVLYCYLIGSILLAFGVFVWGLATAKTSRDPKHDRYKPLALAALPVINIISLIWFAINSHHQKRKHRKQQLELNTQLVVPATIYLINIYLKRIATDPTCPASVLMEELPTKIISRWGGVLTNLTILGIKFTQPDDPKIFFEFKIHSDWIESIEDLTSGIANNPVWSDVKVTFYLFEKNTCLVGVVLTNLPDLTEFEYSEHQVKSFDSF